jgi:NAD(P)H-hydrate epimerase
MYVLKPEEMVILDRITIEELGIPQEVLMENAGRTVYSILKQTLDLPLEDASITVVAGPGNNGGDGIVVARYLLENTRNLSVYLLGKKSSLKGSAQLNLQIFERMGGEVKEISSLNEEVEYSILNSDAIVDAIFGTGFKGKPEGVYKDIIHLINLSGAFVISVDIPSGINGATGESSGIAVLADVTVTMAFPKLGHFLYPGKMHTGELVIANIGIPEYLAKERIKRQTVEEEELRTYFPLRFGPEHKGDVGRVLIFAGSIGFSGAATLASLATLRVGAGLTYLAIPKPLNPILEIKATEVITIPVDEEEGVITRRAVEEVLKSDLSFDCVAMGPGLTRKRQVKEAVEEMLKEFKGPVVLDADAVVVLKDNLDILKGREIPPILTPHPGELGKLLEISATEVNRNRVELSQKFAEENGVILVLKGAPTVIASPDGYIWINTTGNPGLASGGTGDVLTGMIAGFLAQSREPLRSSLLGVYLHGLAGDFAAADLSMHSLMAGDLLDYIPDAINSLFEEDET